MLVGFLFSLTSKGQNSTYVPGAVVLNWGDTLQGELNQYIRFTSNLKFRFSGYYKPLGVDFDQISQFRLLQTWYARKEVKGKGEIFIEDVKTNLVPFYRLTLSRGKHKRDIFYQYYFAVPSEEKLVRLTNGTFHDYLLPLLSNYPNLLESVERVGNDPNQICNILRHAEP